MKRSIIGVLVAATLYVPAGDAAAQATSSPMYMVRQEFVRPSDLARYEAETARWINALQGTRVANDVGWVAVYGPELGYSYVVPIDGFAGIDRFRAHLSTSRSDLGARWSGQIGEAQPIQSVTTFVITLRPDLSYLPRTVALDPTLPFRKYHWYHVMPGMERAFEDAAQRLVSLYAEHGVEHGFLFYEFGLGEDLPIFLLVERAEDAADYTAQSRRILDKVGTDADALFGEMLRFTRHLNLMEGMVRGELSFPPLDPAAQTDLDP